MIEGELKRHQIVEDGENTEEKIEKVKRKFFSGLKSRFLALATAGFLTLGTGWDRGLSRQLNLQGKKGSISEFVLETEVTSSGLEDFKKKIKENEPEFAATVEEYKKAVRIQFDSLENKIKNRNVKDSDEIKFDNDLVQAEIDAWENGTGSIGPGAAMTVDVEHRLIYYIQQNHDFLATSHEFIKKNLDDILWSIVFLNNSQASRRAMTESIRPPTIVLGLHNPGSRATTTPLPAPMMAKINSGEKDGQPAQWHPEITVFPSAFMGLDRQANANTYINILIHELIHAVLAGSWDKKKIDRKMGMDFAEILDEGRTQSLTYKIIRHLDQGGFDLKPVFGETGSYDQNLVIAEILESAAKTKSDGNLLVEWQIGMMDSKKMLNDLRTALNDLGLEGNNIVQSLVGFQFGTNPVENSLNLLADLLIQLKLQNVNLSKDFIKSILIKEGKRHSESMEKVDEWTDQLSKIISEKLNNAGH